VCPASTPDCDAATYFTSTDTDCNDHYEALFPALRTGTGVYIGVAFVIGIVVFICGLLLCARRRTDDFESSALQVASRTDNLDADDSDEEGDKRVYKKEDLVKKRNRIIKNYGQVGGLLALHSLALLSMAIVTPYWTSDTLGKFDTTNYENATVEFQYGLWDFTAYGGSDLLHEQIVSEHGTGTWGTHCNHTRFVDNPSLLPSGFCDWQGDSLKYVTITCASMSAVMVLMLLVNYPIQVLSTAAAYCCCILLLHTSAAYCCCILLLHTAAAYSHCILILHTHTAYQLSYHQAYSQIGSYLSALQAIGSMFVVSAQRSMQRTRYSPYSRYSPYTIHHTRYSYTMHHIRMRPYSYCIFTSRWHYSMLSLYLRHYAHTLTAAGDHVALHNARLLCQ
jgi:hypothetical protein